MTSIRTLATTAALTILVACNDPMSRPADDATITTSTSTTPGSSSSDPAPSTDATTSTTDNPATTTSEAPSTTEALTSSTTTATNTDTTSETTGAPLPDFDALPWQTGDDIGVGIAYKDSGDPDAHNVFIGYAGYPFPLDAAESWATALYHARLQALGVRHVYAVQGPATVMYEDLEIGNTHIAQALGTQADGAQFVLVAAHSSGSYVAHELLAQLAGDWDPQGVTNDKLVYFNLDGGTAFLTDAAVARLRRAYFVSVFDTDSDTAAPNRDAMQYLGDKWPTKGSFLDLDGSQSGCNAGAQWCLHMVVINSLPHDKTKSDVTDYYDFQGRPVVTQYIDQVADAAGIHP